MEIEKKMTRITFSNYAGKRRVIKTIIESICEYKNHFLNLKSTNFYLLITMLIVSHWLHRRLSPETFETWMRLLWTTLNSIHNFPTEHIRWSDRWWSCVRPHIKSMDFFFHFFLSISLQIEREMIHKHTRWIKENICRHLIQIGNNKKNA